MELNHLITLYPKTPKADAFGRYATNLSKPKNSAYVPINNPTMLDSIPFLAKLKVEHNNDEVMVDRVNNNSPKIESELTEIFDV